jgi:Leucine zipper with capping helix domain/Mnd1 HTH domain
MAKRMSAEEKRKVILDIYHKSKSVYVEKEILTLAAKAGVNANTYVEKGPDFLFHRLTTMVHWLYALCNVRTERFSSICLGCSVADMNQSLIDDGLVDKEKVGGTNYFWSFPAKKDSLDQKRHEKVLAQIAQLKTSVDEAQVALQDAKRGREDDEEELDASDTPSNDADNPDEGVKERPVRQSRAAKIQRLEEISKQRVEAAAELDKLKENDPQALADLDRELSLVQQAANRWTDNIFNCQSYLIKKRGMDKKEAMKILGITSTFDCECSCPRRRTLLTALSFFSTLLFRSHHTRSR